MDDNFSEQYDNDFQNALNRFEKMLENNEQYFFDVEELEDLVTYFIETNDTEKALKVIGFGTQQHPYSTNLIIRHAQVLATSHKPAEALELLNRVENIEPSNFELLYNKACVYGQLRNPKKAIQYFEKALLNCDLEEKEEILLSIGFEYETTNEYLTAIDYFKQALEINPENETALYEISFCFDILDKTDEAISFFNKFIDEHPYSSVSWYNLGMFYSKQEKNSEAIMAYDYAITIKEDFSSAYFGKANVLFNTEKYAQALKAYKEFMQYEKADSLVYFYVGECYENMDDYANALPYYQRAVKLDPNFADAWLGMAIVYGETERYHSAIHFVKKAIELDNEQAHYFVCMGEFYSKASNHIEALKAFKKASEIEPSDKEIYLDIAEELIHLEGIKKGIIYLEDIMNLYPDNEYAAYRLSALYFKQKETKKAKEALKTALTLNSKLITELFEYLPELSDKKDVQKIIHEFNSRT